jgi:hypothetical protein
MPFPGIVRSAWCAAVLAMGIAACGSGVMNADAPTARADGTIGDGGSDAGPTGDDAGDGDAPPPVDLEPYGLPALLAIERLAHLRRDTQAGQESSYDRTGGNRDGFGASNFLYVDGSGEKVMVDLAGPGTVYVLWFTGFDPATAWLKVYFDDEATPRLDRPLADLFAGSAAPFEWPLALDLWASSGGYVSYLPLPFARAIRITTNGAGDHFFYHVGYHLFAPDREITSWTGDEDTAPVREVWGTLGAPPTAGAAAPTDTGVIDVPAGEEQVFLEGAGPGVVHSLKLRIPGIVPGTATDSGRAHRGTTRFLARLDPANSGVTLRRRLDYGVGNQTARVLVDGRLVGTWADPGAALSGEWRDSSFELPAAVTAGRTQIEVRVAFVSADADWNEFQYWVLSSVNDAAVLTDVLDVGHAGDEAAHGYAVTAPTWAGWRTCSYPTSGVDARELLNGLRLKAYWDGEAAPAVDAPLGAFFGLGQFGTLGAAAALPMGLDQTGELYAYFPMPYATHVRLALASERADPTLGVAFAVARGPLTGNLARVGRFKTAFGQTALLADDGADVPILDVSGAGHLVGVLESLAGPASRAYLEGDERIYVDGRGTPAFQGTGREDFYQGGWYFLLGPFSRATHGHPAHVIAGDTDATVAYRLFLADAIPFRTHLRVGVEHGNRNDTAVEAWTLAYYYHRETPLCRSTDEVDVANPASEAGHGYAVTDATWAGTRSATFEGAADGVTVTDDGRAHAGRSTFTLALDPGHGSVILRRRFDQTVAHQRAEVWIDGQRAGVWYRAGGNVTHGWREEDFIVPAALTRGKAQIAVEVRFVSSDLDWNEFRYWAFSCDSV